MVGILFSLLGIGKNLLSRLSSGVRWLFGAWERIVIAALLAACLWLYVGKQAETRRADKMTTVAAKWESAYVLVIEAQRLATIAAEKNKARVEAAYQEINNEAEQDYELRIADSRAALQRFLRQNSGSAASQGNGTGKPEMPDPALPATGDTFFPITRKDLEIAADNHAQLLALISWAKAVGEVNTTPEEIIPAAHD